MLRVPDSIVDVTWLQKNRNAPNLVILDATMHKVSAINESQSSKQFIPNSIFFDIKNEFSNKEAKYPNTMLPSEIFERKVQDLGISQDSCIVVYDAHGVYSSPRVWFMFESVGFKNIAVLNGGLPAWINLNLEVVDSAMKSFIKGNFKAKIGKRKFVDKTNVVNAIKGSDFIVLDARPEGRFNGTTPEPRKDVASGHIPNSLNLPYSDVLNNSIFKSKKELKKIFHIKNPNNKPMIFSCGSGITACIVALSANIAGYDKLMIYDGSWTEWGSTNYLPIEV